MRLREFTQILRDISSDAPLDAILQRLCVLAVGGPGKDGQEGPEGACILVAEAAGAPLRPVAAEGIPIDECGAVAELVRGGHLEPGRGAPHAIGERSEDPAAQALEATALGRRFDGAWTWPLQNSEGGALGLLVRFLSRARPPRRAERNVLEAVARLAVIAIEHRRNASGRAQGSEMLATIVDNVNQGIAVFDEDLRLVHFNQFFADLHRPPEGLLRHGVHYGDIIRYLAARGEYGDVDPDEFVRERLAQLPEIGDWHNLRHRPDGTAIAIYRKSLPGGGLIVTFTDVTADFRKSIEAEASARLLDTTVNNIEHGVKVIDREGRLILWNEAYQELWDLPDELLKEGVPYVELVRYSHRLRGDPDDTDLECIVENRLSETRKAPRSTKIKRMPNGRTIRYTRGVMPDGGFVTTYTDVTKLVEAEAELERKSNLLQTTLDNISQGFLVIDEDLNVILFNDSYRRMFGLGKDALHVGMSYREVLMLMAGNDEFAGEHGSREEIIERRLSRARANEPLQYLHVRVDGTIAAVVRKPMPEGGQVVTYTDITDLKRVEAELMEARDAAEAANRAKSEFLANMSHELRTPLNAVIGFSEIMADKAFGPVGDPRYEDYVHSIHESGIHLLSLINDLLDLSKIEVGKAVLEEEEVHLAAAVESCAALLRDQAAKGGLELVTDCRGDFPPVLGDRRRLKQIVINLLQNAVKFTPAGGRVGVSLHHDSGGGIRITVRDTGIGIPEEDIPRALERFGQVETGFRRRFDGTGLGLPLAQTLAALHGGRLEIESARGQGTAVHVVLPASRVIARTRQVRTGAG